MSVIGPTWCGIFADEFADAELAAVPSLGQLANPDGSAGEVGHPFAELRRGSVAASQAFDDRVGRKLAALKGEVYAGRIDRIDESPRIAHEHPAVAGRFVPLCTNTLSRRPSLRLFPCLRAARPSPGNRPLRRRKFRPAYRRRAGRNSRHRLRRRCSRRRSTSGMCQNQDRFDCVRRHTVITPFSITSRREPRKWPQMAALRKFGFGLRRANRAPSKPAWPVASTTTLARINSPFCPAAEAASPATRTPTARSPSNTTSSTRTPR